MSGRIRVSKDSRRPVRLAEIFCGFPLSLQTYTGIIPKIYTVTSTTLQLYYRLRSITYAVKHTVM
jgi:hypothetical protein